MQDNEPINLTYGQMSDMVNRIEQIPPLSGAGAPTSSTPAFYIGQTYLDTTTDELYYCTSIPGENDPLEYTWEPIDTNTTYSDFVGTDSSAPTTATVGRLGQIQIDTTTATAYMCVEADDVTPSYTWKQITA